MSDSNSDGTVEKSDAPTASRIAPRRLVIEIDEGWTPEDGDAFDAVIAALDHFEIPSTIRELEEPVPDVRSERQRG